MCGWGPKRARPWGERAPTVKITSTVSGLRSQTSRPPSWQNSSARCNSKSNGSNIGHFWHSRQNLKRKPSIDAKKTSTKPSQMSSSGNVGNQEKALDPFVSLEGYHESRSCSKHTFPEFYINQHTSIGRQTRKCCSDEET